MKELIEKYEKEIAFLNERLETAIFIGYNQKIRIETEKAIYLKIINDLKSALANER